MRMTQGCFRALVLDGIRWWLGLPNISVMSDNCNQMCDRCLKDWWDGETYFDLGGRDQSDFERAVAATRKSRPVRNKSEVVAANHGLRAEGLPCLGLCRKAEPRTEKGDTVIQLLHALIRNSVWDNTPRRFIRSRHQRSSCPTATKLRS